MSGRGPRAARRPLPACAAALLAFGSNACVGTETGNPTLEAHPEVGFVSLAPEGSITGESPALEIRVAVGSFRALRCDNGSTALSEPFPVLLDSPGSSAISIPETSCCGLVLGLEPQLLGPVGQAGLASVLVTGTLANGTPLVIQSEAPLTITLVPDTLPLVLDAESRWLLGFDLGVLFTGFDPTTVAPGPDGIRIDAASAPAALATFEASFVASAALYRDLDGDGEHDPEDTAVAVPQ